MDTEVIYCGDNLEVMPKHIPDESVDLIYIDPPFNSSRNYEVFWGEAQERRAFEDRFGDVMTYLDWMRPRIRELHRVLKPTGSFYYHCDWHASHYIKVELDRVFSFNNFKNEIVWCYDTGGRSTTSFPKKHDIILRYGRGGRTQFNYDSVALPRDPNTMHESVALDDEGKPYQRNIKLGREYRYYLDKGVLPNDWWIDIQALNPAAKERLGYPTQKPLALLERIVRASSNEGDIVLDAFCGCGTTLEAAAKDKRRWIGIDMSPTACRVMADRLEKRLNLKEGIDFQLVDMPKTEDDLRRIPHREFENWAVIALGGIPNEVKVGDYGIDGRLYLADIEKARKGDFFETLDRWYPIQVKQQDRVGRPDIDNFQTAMRRDKRLKGYFIAFGFSRDSIAEIKRANQHDGLDIVPITVKELLQHERVTG
jgi:DNA modification methylase